MMFQALHINIRFTGIYSLVVKALDKIKSKSVSKRTNKYMYVLDGILNEGKSMLIFIKEKRGTASGAV